MKIPFLQFVLLALILLACRCFAQAPDYCQADETPNYLHPGNGQFHVFDGPAELPQRCVATNPWNMPSPNGVVSVAAGQSLQAAYNSAICGTAIKLAHAGVWTGPFNFASKHCPDAAWITIESDGKLPAAGVRVSPADASQMVKITTTGSKASKFGDHLRIVGIEWGPKDSTSLVYNLTNQGGADHVVFERNYFHGNPIQEVQRGIQLNTGKYIAIIDSYLAEFHCTAIVGACGDAQGISGGTGSPTDLISQAGPYKIWNNFVEGSTENLNFGGDIADGCPTDITVQNNHFYKPPSWNPWNSGFIGTKYVVKNNLEFKNGCRALIEGNVFENNWGGFTQIGYAVLLTPKSQEGPGGTSLCPKCIVTDVTFRYNLIKNAAGAMMIASAPNAVGGWSEGIHRVSIHDDAFVNLQYAGCYGCGSSLFLLGSAYQATNPPTASEIMSDVSISNINVLAAGDLSTNGTSEFLVMSGPPIGVGVPQLTNIGISNSVLSTMKAGMYSAGGGTENCMFFAKPQIPVNEWSGCTAGNSPFANNLLIGWTKAQAQWPSGQQFAPTFTTAPAGIGANMATVSNYTKGAALIP